MNSCARRTIAVVSLLALAASSVFAGVSSGALAPGTLDGSWNSPRTGANGSVSSVANVSDGSYVIGGSFSRYNGTKANRVAHINSDGTLDAAFSKNLSDGFNSNVTSTVALPDGKVLVGGTFTRVTTLDPADPTKRVSRKACGLTRLNSDGTLDTAFNPTAKLAAGASPGATTADTVTCSYVTAITLQGADDQARPLVAGTFRTWNGYPRSGIVRLNPDGSIDDTFDPGLSSTLRVSTTAGSKSATLSTASELKPNSTYRISSATIPASLRATFLTTGGSTVSTRITLSAPAKATGTSVLATLTTTGVGGPGSGAFIVNAVAVDHDTGKVVIGGKFANYDGTTRFNVARLNIDGQLDTGFDPGLGPDDAVQAVAVAVDSANLGKVYIGGSFSKFGTATRNRIARLGTNGANDASFNPAAGATGSATPGLTGGTGFVPVAALLPQSDGSVYAAGSFVSYGGADTPFLTKLRADGSRDTSFTMTPARAVGNSILSAVIDGDGNLVVGGFFDRGVARLSAEGVLDRDATAETGFNYDIMTAANGAVNAVDVVGDNSAYVGGAFTAYDKEPHSKFVHLNADGTPDASCDPGEIDGSVNVVKVLGSGDVPGSGTFALVGDIVIGGSFTSVGGTAAHGIALLDSSCHLKSTFGTGAQIADGSRTASVNAIAISPVGKKFLIGGDFDRFGAADSYYTDLARVNPEGTVDTTFEGGIFDAPVYALAVEATGASAGKVLVGGDFTRFTWFGPGEDEHPVAVGRLLRLTSTGHIDTDGAHKFNLGTAANGPVRALAIQRSVSLSGTKILVGGYFDFFNGQARNRLVRLKEDGTLENGFDVGGPITDSPPTLTATSGSTSAVLSDTSMLAPNTTYGFYSTDDPAAVPATSRATLSTGGMVDDGTGTMIVDTHVTLSVGPTTDMNDELANTGIALVQRGAGGGGVRQILVQGGPKIIAVGSFKNFDGVSRNQIVRLKDNGSVDSTFKPGVGFTGYRVNAMDFQGTSSLIVGGEFSAYNGSARNRIIRIAR